jgi:hypothetical protein
MKNFGEKKQNDASANLVFQIRAAKLPAPITEHKFHPTRKWRFDLAWPYGGFAVEIEGGIWSGGRHTRGTGFIKDMEKYNEANLLGWHVYRVSPGQVLSGEALALIERIFKLFHKL